MVFIDELDAVGGRRGGGGGSGGNDERDQTLNQLLTEMDGFDSAVGVRPSVVVNASSSPASSANGAAGASSSPPLAPAPPSSATGVLLLAATNRPEVLDPALVRPGRLSRRVAVPLPDEAGRAAVLGVHLAKIRLEGGAGALPGEAARLARAGAGLSGAQLADVANDGVVPSSELIARVEAEFGPLADLGMHAADPAHRYQIAHAKGSIGFISSVSEPFCSTCNRMRLTADGRLHLCLLRDDEVDLRAALRAGVDDAELMQIVRHAVAIKPWGHGLSDNILPTIRGMSALGG